LETANGKMKTIHPAQIQETAKALSGDIRLRILEILSDRTMSITQLMEELGVAQPTVSINVQLLEQAGLVETSQGANREKLCTRACDALFIELPKTPGEALHEREEIEMPVGLFTDCSVEPTCGLAGKDGIIGCPDDPRSFFLPERAEAELLWFSGAGFVEYRFPNPLPPEVGLKELRISAEMCSEALGFKEDWPSDVTLFVNGHNAGTVTLAGDYGKTKGTRTPTWWVYGTQYGELHEWVIDRNGSCADGLHQGDASLDKLGLDFREPVAVRFEVQKTAKHRGGLNLFGAGFGNYPQAVKLTFVKH